MKPVLNILIKIWVQQFYQRNAGFFLFLFVVLFGVVQNPLSYHYKLMQGIVTSYATLMFALIIWGLYALKCNTLVLKSIYKENTWLCQLQAICTKQLLLLLTIVEAMLYLPVTIYIAFTIGVGAYLHQYAVAVILVTFLVLVHVLSAVWYYYTLAVNSNRLPWFKNSTFKLRIPKGFFSYLICYNLYKGKLKTVAVKFFSFILLFIPLVWNRSYIELSDFVIFFQLSIAAHAVLVYDNVQFLEKDFRVLRNVPLSLYKMFTLFIITYLFTLLPEFAFLSYFGSRAQLNISNASMLLYYLAQLILFTALAYERHQKIENYLLYIGLITVLLLLLSPLNSFGWIGIVLIIIAFTLFATNYYQYEPDYQIAGKQLKGPENK